VGEELLVFEYNKVSTWHWYGFHEDRPPKQNGDWTTPLNFRDGSLHVRAEIRGIPVEQPGMRLGFCFWQRGMLNGESYYFETCTTRNVPGIKDNITTWSTNIKDMWKHGNHPLDWAQPRTVAGLVIKSQHDIPVGLKNASHNWGCGDIPGCDPDHTKWYPLNIRFTVVAVQQGHAFSGWENYINP